MAIYRSMNAERVRQFAAAMADGRSVAHLANGRKPEASPVTTGAPKIGAELAKLTERITDAQVAARQDWMAAACQYARNYAGTFDYMLDMRCQIETNGLTIAQMRGVLNCMRAEAIRIVNARTAAIPAAETSVETTTYNEILDGYYTVKFDDGSHVTIRVNTLSAKQSRDGKPHQFAAYLCGPINTSDYRRFAEIKGATFRAFRSDRSSYGSGRQDYAKQVVALKILMGTNDQTQYGRAYAKLATRCYRCGKLLTEPESIESGIGPICAGRE